MIVRFTTGGIYAFVGDWNYRAILVGDGIVSLEISQVAAFFWFSTLPFILCYEGNWEVKEALC